jgi:pantetheine-phosphate adenylyltransferase
MSISKTSEKIAIFPGTFDPITRGHLDVIARAEKLFDKLIVAVGRNPEKSELFPINERITIIESLLADHKNVSVEAYEGLTVELVKRRHAVAILRGLRNMTDLEYEFQIALTNRHIANVETVFIMTSEQFGFTSSSLIKQIVSLGGDPSQLASLLPDPVIAKLRIYAAQKIGPFAQVKDALKS